MKYVGESAATKPQHRDNAVRPLIEKRRDGRMLCSDFAHISFADQKGDPISDVGLLEDVGARGVTISLSVPLPISKRVRILTKGFEGDAIVRHTELGDYGFLVGLEFADGYEWDREKWTPEHLLDIPGGEE